MTTARNITLPADQQELKGATRALLRAFGGQEAAAMRLGTRQQRLSDCSSPNTDAFMRIDEVAALESETIGHPGHPYVLATLARQIGFELVRTPTAKATGTDMLQLFAQQSRETSDLAVAICDAHADGHISIEDAIRIEAELDDVIANALAMRAEIRVIRKDMA
jgi:hypothetical protein